MPEFIPVSVALNGQVTIACYPLDRTLVYRKVLSARSQEIQLPNHCWVDRGDQKKCGLFFFLARRGLNPVRFRDSPKLYQLSYLEPHECGMMSDFHVCHFVIQYYYFRKRFETIMCWNKRYMNELHNCYYYYYYYYYIYPLS